MRKKTFEVTWNGKRVSIVFKGVSWVLTALEGQPLSQTDKMEIIKAVVNYG